MNKSIVNFEFNSHSLCEGMLLITKAIRDDFPIERVKQELDELTQCANAYISKDLETEQQLTLLIKLFYQEWGFGSASGVYSMSDSLWLDKVLTSKAGAPAALGIILHHIAERLDIPLHPVIFPTQMLLQAAWLDDERWIINPLTGETLTTKQLEQWLKGYFSSTISISDDDLDFAENSSVIIKMLNALKGALMQENQPELALRATELALFFDPENPYEIRDRGLILAQLECNHVAVTDLNYFIEHCPEDPVADIIKMQISAIEQSHIQLH